MEIISEIKKIAPAYAVLTAALIYFGMIAPGAKTPDFLRAK